MDNSDKEMDLATRKRIGFAAIVGYLLTWLSQPPAGIWMVALICLIPLLWIISLPKLSRRDYVVIWASGCIYWLISLQGLRNAHPVMYACWFVLSVYLAVYGVLFVAVTRQMLCRKIPIWIAAPIVWVGFECIRNYFATGISAAMLGHTMADVPMMIQIADIFGSYGIGFVIVSINVMVFLMLQRIRGFESSSPVIAATAIAILLLACTLGYGRYRLQQTQTEELATFALIQRFESVEYGQDSQRSAEIYSNYARQSINALRGSSKVVDAVVWPESMYGGGIAWMIAEQNASVPDEFGGTKLEFSRAVQDQCSYFESRNLDLQLALASYQPDASPPQLLAGCGVVRFDQDAHTYSGLIQVDPTGKVIDWYGKTHLVMFGEYVPILGSIPGLKSLIPVGVSVGPGPKTYSLGDTTVMPNICIETAVERVTLNHAARLDSESNLPDVVVTVTNDGWFDDSSVVDHHLRCAQLVAVGIRRPILSAANNGPTAWIDSSGRIVQRLTRGTNGSIVATPLRDDRKSIYMSIGDWPARVLALFCTLFLIDAYRNRHRGHHEERERLPDDVEAPREAGTIDTE